MPDKVEQIMKKIHVLFAKSEDYYGSPDKVVISRKEMFDILEELNVAIYEVLDKYEATTRSKERARLEMERMASDIIADAKKTAEDVNAASLIYTDTMLEEIKSVLEETAAATANQMEILKTQLEERMALIVENRDEVKDKLAELHESEFYLNALQDKRAQNTASLRSILQDIDDNEEDDEPEEVTVKHAEYIIRVNEAYRDKVHSIKETKTDGKKTVPAGNISPTSSDSKIIAKKANDIQEAEDFTDEPKNTGKVKPLDKPDETAAAFAYGEPHVNPDDFDLDGEYYRWKEEQGETTEQENGTKKSKRFLFGRKKDN